MEKLREFFSDAFGFIRQTRESYEGASRFMRMRVWIVALLALDVVGTFAFVFFTGFRSLEVVVWFEPGFPANMLVVRNEESRALPNATLVLDGRYRLVVDKIEIGVNGYEVNRAFRDSSDSSPPDSYKPAQLRIDLGEDSFPFRVDTKSGG